MVQRLGAIENKTDWDVVVHALQAGDYPTGWELPDPNMDQFLEAICFSLDENSLLWDDAVKMIVKGKVEQVVQLHNLEVTLILRDGQIMRTLEPRIDEVFAVIDRWGIYVRRWCWQPSK